MSSKTDPVLIGTVVRPHGLRGELLIFPYTDYQRRWSRGQVVFAEARELTVASVRPTEHGLLVRFAEILDRTEAESLGKVALFIESSARRELAEDEYWPDELVGLEVRDEYGTRLGEIADVDDSTSQARLVVRAEGASHLVPLVSELVPEIDVAGGYVVVRTVPGLFDD